MNKVYIVVADFGYYMEPDIRVLKVFTRKSSAYKYANDFMKKHFIGYRKVDAWVISRKVNL